MQGTGQRARRALSEVPLQLSGEELPVGCGSGVRSRFSARPDGNVHPLPRGVLDCAADRGGCHDVRGLPGLLPSEVAAARPCQGPMSQEPRAAPDVEGRIQTRLTPTVTSCSPYLPGFRPSTSSAARFPTNASTRGAKRSVLSITAAPSKSGGTSAESRPIACLATSVRPMPRSSSSRNSSGRRVRGVRPTSCNTHQKRLPGPAYGAPIRADTSPAAVPQKTTRRPGASRSGRM